MTTCIGMQPSRRAIQGLGAVVRSPAQACLGLAALVLLPFATGTALALSCIGPERLLFPPPGDIPPNPVFILELEGATGDPIRRVPVESFDISFTGGHALARILERSDGPPGFITFAPVKPLREGPMDLRLRRRFAGRPAEWTSLGTYKVHGPADESVPTLLQHEEQVTARVGDPTWGESLTVELPVSADESPVLWLATIDASEEGVPLGRPITMYLPANGPNLYTGACGGNHPLARSKQYLVDLTPIDAAGHRGKVTKRSILVEVP